MKGFTMPTDYIIGKCSLMTVAKHWSLEPEILIKLITNQDRGRMRSLRHELGLPYLGRGVTMHKPDVNDVKTWWLSNSDVYYVLHSLNELSDDTLTRIMTISTDLKTELYNKYNRTALLQRVNDEVTVRGTVTALAVNDDLMGCKTVPYFVCVTDVTFAGDTSEVICDHLWLRAPNTYKCVQSIIQDRLHTHEPMLLRAHGIVRLKAKTRSPQLQVLQMNALL